MSDSMVLSLVDVTNQYDKVFWFGDFNFSMNIDREEVEAILSAHTGDKMDFLLQHDQLLKAMKDGQSWNQSFFSFGRS